MSFKKVNPQLNLPKLEEEILRFWDENKIFAKSLEIRKDSPRYIFYDGPPFATGTPHYGHIVGSIMKDVVPRYWTMKGKLVERRWGWDCHGLPIENIAEKELGIKSKKEIEEMGVDKFNEFCRSKILGYVGEWEKVIRRLGRWVDMNNAYKTMDLDYMESVWWVFKQLYDKGLVYEGYRSMHICPRCETTLSQSEVAEGYKDIKDLSVTAKFELSDEPGTYILAWTTTPWTLLGNVALAINEKIIYCKVQRSKFKDQNDGVENHYILAKERVADIFKDNEYKIIEEYTSKDLVGKRYQPLFDIDKNIQNAENGWQIVLADFVSTDEGTGIVHIAPAFGEDDMNLGKKLNLPFVQHVGMDGIIKSGYGEFSGLSVKPVDDVQSTDVAIIKYLANKNLLFDKAQYEHSYPHCWRCETPLINYATSSWFVAVEKIKSEAIKLSTGINWTPKHIKKGRFGMWLECARDWSISRQRFWASVIPIWRCDKCGEIKVVGSVRELEELSGEKVTDLHKHIVDKISFKCGKLACRQASADGEMRRIPDVLDTWFDSGSMPYAQMHYPFENKEKFEANFPAEFIVEGVDQTRAWFYYLHILSTAVMNKPAYKNVVVNGIVLAEDGKKMSKRLQNYPDPMAVFDKYGADVLRLYLLSSPVMAAENLSLKESELQELQRGFFRMLWNSYYFFVLYASLDNWQPKAYAAQPKNLLDRWIITKTEKLNIAVERNMQAYNLPAATRQFFSFVDDLSNWYIRRSRKRFWKSESDEDKNNAYQTLHFVLVKLSKLLAPFAPFISDEIYKNISGEESVHLADFPSPDKELLDEVLVKQMDQTKKHVESALAIRAKAGIKVRQPLECYYYAGEKLTEDFEEILKDEINVKRVEHSKEEKLNEKLSSELILEGYAREIVRSIQSLRKKADFQISDRIITYYSTSSLELGKTLKDDNLANYIKKETLSLELENRKADNVDCSEEIKIDRADIWFGVKRKQ